MLQPLESICMADERKVQRDGSSQSSHSLPHASPLSPSLSAGEFDTKYNYALWLQLQYRQQLAALQSTVTAAAAHELAQPRPDFQKGPRQDAQAFPFGAASGFGVSHGYGKSPEAGPSPPLERVTNPYSQPGFGFDPLQDSSIGKSACQVHSALDKLASSIYDVLVAPCLQSVSGSVVYISQPNVVSTVHAVLTQTILCSICCHAQWSGKQ